MSCPSNCYKAALGQCLDEASAADSTKATNAHVFQVVTSCGYLFKLHPPHNAFSSALPVYCQTWGKDKAFRVGTFQSNKKQASSCLSQIFGFSFCNVCITSLKWRCTVFAFWLNMLSVRTDLRVFVHRARWQIKAECFSDVPSFMWATCEMCISSVSLVWHRLSLSFFSFFFEGRLPNYCQCKLI